MWLAHDLLDSQLVDRDGRAIGKVDGVALQVRPESAPRVVALEVGALVLARRVHPRLARWLARRTRRWGPFAPGAYRVPWSLVRDVTPTEVRLDVDARSTPPWTLERWLAERVVGRLPGGS